VRIAWTTFLGSSHCEDGIAEFAAGNLNFASWEKWHLPHMKEQAKYVRKIRHRVPLAVARKRAAEVARRLYGPGWK